MNIEIILAVIMTVGIAVLSIKKLIGFQLNVTVMTRIGLVAAITIVLYMIKLVPFPQGGGCSLLSILPIMILSIMFGIKEGLVCAMIVALVKIILAPPYYPLQIPLDYFGGMMAIPFTVIFGFDKKSKLLLGAVIAVLISTFFSILSGVIFFSQFAPEGMNPWLYATIYNFLGYGVEAALSIIVLLILPLTHLRQVLVKKEVKA